MKMLMALASMLALISVGIPAAAGPFGFSMGDPIKPKEGWSPGGYGSELEEYKGVLGFDYVSVSGTREGGACQVAAVNFVARKDAENSYQNLKESLSRKYGKPSAEEQDQTVWIPSENPDKISAILLKIDDAPAAVAIGLGIADLYPRSIAVRSGFRHHATGYGRANQSSIRRIDSPLLATLRRI